jgi:hypothetical protein
LAVGGLAALEHDRGKLRIAPPDLFRSVCPNFGHSGLAKNHNAIV